MKLPFRRKGKNQEQHVQPSPSSVQYEDDPDDSEGVLTINGILEMSPYEFEEFVLETLENQGYRELELTRRSGDLGVDIIGRTRRGKVVAVQCKRYAPGNKISSPALQTFFGMAKFQYEADVSIFVTTSGFTGDAINLARRHGIELIDGPGLVLMQAYRRTESRPSRRPRIFGR